MIYEYRCVHHHVTQKICSYRDYEEAVSCDECDLVARRIFTPPIMVTAAQDLCYDSPIDGAPITSHAARKEDLKRHGCIPYDPEMKKDAARKKHERQAEFDAKVETTVKESIARLPEQKKRQLKKEVVNQGAGLAVKRG